MSDKNTQNTDSEEVDLGQLFNAIGKLFERFFRFIGSIFKGILSIIVFFLKAIIQYFKIIAAVILIAFIIGFAIDKAKAPVFYGNMLVEPYFESQYQLASNIDYYNSLVETENYSALASIFDLSEDDVSEILSFKLDKGPETENDLLQEYDKYLTSVDSTVAKQTTFEAYKKNRDMFSSSVFSIEVYSRKRDVFRDLNNGFAKSFDNEYSRTLKSRRDSIAKLRKFTFQRNLSQLDSMKIVYLKIKVEEAKNNAGKLGMQSMIPITQEKAETREYDLLQSELKLRDSIRSIDQAIINKNVYYDVISRFPEIGVKHKTFANRFSLFFPAISFLGLCLIFIILKVIRYAKNYNQ